MTLMSLVPRNKCRSEKRDFMETMPKFNNGTVRNASVSRGKRKTNTKPTTTVSTHLIHALAHALKIYRYLIARPKQDQKLLHYAFRNAIRENIFQMQHVMSPTKTLKITAISRITSTLWNCRNVTL